MTYRLPERSLRNRIGSSTPASRLAVSVALHIVGGGMVTAGAAAELVGNGGLPETYIAYATGCYAMLVVLMLLHLNRVQFETRSTNLPRSPRGVKI